MRAKLSVNIDWSLLRDQKEGLLSVIHNNDKLTEPQKDSLQGILHLIDGIQDYAVDELGLDKNEVFYLIED